MKTAKELEQELANLEGDAEPITGSELVPPPSEEEIAAYQSYRGYNWQNWRCEIEESLEEFVRDRRHIKRLNAQIEQDIEALRLKEAATRVAVEKT